VIVRSDGNDFDVRTWRGRSFSLDERARQSAWTTEQP
jgi:hypothetical protein